jgi:DNA-binding MarR family transcriptional regulator
MYASPLSGELNLVPEGRTLRRMATGRSSDKQTLAARAWRRLFELFMSTRWHRDRVLERYGLTPNDAKALSSLDPTNGKPMRALADEWGTDASNATWVVDRLERQGLAERRTTASDRRVKLVVLTAEGEKTRTEILQAFHEPPTELLALDRQDLQTLGEILGKLAKGDPAQQPSAGEDSPVATKRASPRRPPTGGPGGTRGDRRV